MSQVKVGDVERAVARWFPPERAEEWDKNGLLAGDPDAAVTGVLVALDPTPATIRAAMDAGANVLVTHHPAFLKPPQWLTPGRGSAGTVFSALSKGVALINAHTSLDRDGRAQALLPERLGLSVTKPLERSVQPMALVTTFVPESAADRVAEAMAGAGAGRIGDYERCSFSVEGEGRFTAPPDASPAAGEPGSANRAAERRIEMVAPRSRARGVVAAAAAAHPYEEPLVTVAEVDLARNAARLGAVSDVPGAVSLGAFAQRCADTFGVDPRVWGDAGREVRRVATATGSAGSLIGDALAARCDVLVAGEVRYHDALDAAGAGLAVVELGHDVTEWPLVTLLEQAVRSVAGLDGTSVHVAAPEPAWWTCHRSEERP